MDTISLLSNGCLQHDNVPFQKTNIVAVNETVVILLARQWVQGISVASFESSRTPLGYGTEGGFTAWMCNWQICRNYCMWECHVSSWFTLSKECFWCFFIHTMKNWSFFFFKAKGSLTQNYYLNSHFIFASWKSIFHCNKSYIVKRSKLQQHRMNLLSLQPNNKVVLYTSVGGALTFLDYFNFPCTW